MKTKQVIGIAIAAIIFSTVCTVSVFVNSYAEKSLSAVKTSMSSAFSENLDLPDNDYMGVVKISGTIQGETSSTLFEKAEYDQKHLLNYVDRLIKSDSNRGIILLINSPGGSVYETDEMYLKLMEYKKKTKRPIYAYMQQEACSGGYYMAMAADKIYANRNGMTGSIGVIFSLMNASELYKKLGIKEENIVSGRNKAMGSMGTEMTSEQRAILQAMVDEAYEQFVGIVAKGRKMDVNKVKKLADGRIYTPKQAKKEGLIDEVATYDEFIDFVKGAMEDEDIDIYYPDDDSDINFFSELFSQAKDLKPKSESQVLVELLEKEGNGGLLYYAK